MLRGVTIGCGFFSRIQMQAWKRVKGAEMVAACDLDAEKAKAFAADFDIAAYADLDRMIAECKPDFVDIATRPATHLELTRLVAAKGLPILIQKPLAETWDQAKQLVATAETAGVRLMVNENWRWQRWYREAKSLIEAGRLGQVFYYSMQVRNHDGLGPAPFPNQPYFKDMPRFLIMESLVHQLDTARFLFGDITEIYCKTGKLNPLVRAEDFVQILTEHAGGVRGVIDGNRASYPDEPGQAMELTRIEGFDGSLRLRHSGDLWIGDQQVFDAADLPGYKGDSCRAAQQHFVDCLARDAPFETPGGDYLAKTFAAVEACYLSAARNQPVRVAEAAAI